MGVAGWELGIRNWGLMFVVSGFRVVVCGLTCVVIAVAADVAEQAVGAGAVVALPALHGVASGVWGLGFGV